MMKSLATILTYFVCISILFAQAENFEWVSHSLGEDTEHSFDLAADQEGNTYSIGWFRESMEIGNYSFISRGFFDILFVKHDPNGNLLWAQSLGGQSNDAGFAIAVDPFGQVVITGGIRNKVYMGMSSNGPVEINDGGGLAGFVAKYAPDGTLLWVHMQKSGSFVDGWGIGTDQFGSVYASGSFWGAELQAAGDSGSQVTGSGGGDDMVSVYTVKYDPAGTVVHMNTIPGYDVLQAHGMDVSNEGKMVLTGSFNGDLDIGGNIVTARGNGDMYIVQYGINGDLEWFDQAGGHSEFTQLTDGGNDVAFDAQGNVFLTGYFADSLTIGNSEMSSAAYQDIFVAKYNDQGVALWAESIKGFDLHDQGTKIITDSQGNCYIHGYYNTEMHFWETFVIGSHGNIDVFLAKISGSGDPIWVKHGGSSLNDYPGGIALDAEENIYMSGRYGSSTQPYFDDLTPAFSGNQWYDMFVAKVPSDNMVGISYDQERAEQLLVYPNPGQNFIHISFEEVKKGILSVYNLQGELMHRKPMTSELHTISSEVFAPGPYLIELKTAELLHRAIWLKQ